MFLSCHRLQTVVPTVILASNAMGLESFLYGDVSISSSMPTKSPLGNFSFSSNDFQVRKQVNSTLKVLLYTRHKQDTSTPNCSSLPSAFSSSLALYK